MLHCIQEQELLYCFPCLQQKGSNLSDFGSHPLLQEHSLPNNVYTLLYVFSSFLSRVTILIHAEREFVLPIPSVRPSVYPMAALCVNEMNILSLFLTIWLRYHFRFVSLTGVTKFQCQNPLPGGVKCTRDRKISAYVAHMSITVRDRPIVTMEH